MQAQEMRRELRGVWLTTLLGLDWPAASLRGNADAQRQALRDILDDLAEQRYNTVFFQVRSRGNAMYRSNFEPWASELTGTLGRDPGWDPLAFAIEEAHARGMELHAWFNVYRVWSRGTAPASVPVHVTGAHPDWVQRYGDDIWIDPGIPEARAYLVQIAEDLVRNYPIDGLHFDYVRYADRGFKDEETYRRYGKGQPRDDWRRDNVSAFVRDAYVRCTAIRPSLQIGSAPIGIYRNLPTARGWEGRNAISQDSRRWLREGYHDYVVPQIYWGLLRRGSNIDFEALVEDWKRESAGRHVHAGVAAYKENVLPWLADHIDATRDRGADGVVFFRYEHVRRNQLGRRFERRTLAPSMTWRDAVRPNPPRRLRTEGAVLHWDPPVPAADGDTASWYAVYHRGAREGSDDLLEVLPALRTAWPMPHGVGEEDILITALDAFRNESAAAGRESPLAAAPELPPAPSMPVFGPRIASPIAVGKDLILLGYELDKAAFVRLRLMDATGAEALVLLDGWQPAGMHVLGIDRTRLQENITRYIFETGDFRTIMDFPTEG
ncbi:MAG: family 10 glycosylhydrolase [Bacteroidetes bacterium]|nr:family 10 glycosylhydrolase [Bacteroidota bacterium]